MKNKILILLVLFFTIAFSNIKAQRPRDLRVSGIGEISNFSNGSLSSYGIYVEYFLNKNFSIDYQYSFGTNQKGNFYCHYPGTVSWLIESIKYSKLEEESSPRDPNLWIALLVATFAFPEGVSFHTYPRPWLEIAPFVNPFSTDYNILNNDHSTITASIGIRTHLKVGNHLSLAPHFGIKHIYKNNDNGTIYGLGLSWLF